MVSAPLAAPIYNDYFRSRHRFDNSYIFVGINYRALFFNDGDTEVSIVASEEASPPERQLDGGERSAGESRARWHAVRLARAQRSQ